MAAPRTGGEYAQALDDAVTRSGLARLPAAARAQLIAGGTRIDAPARSIVYRELDRPLSVLVVHGVLRIYTTSFDGREFTLFWPRGGDWIGNALVTGEPFEVNAQAVTAATLHVLPVELIERIARSDASVSWAIARASNERLRQALSWIRMLAFLDLRGRVTQRLLELAFRMPAGAPLIAEVTQQELADSVGSPRTSVARVLADLRREGVVRSVPGGILVVRPERLAPGPRPVRGTA